MMSGWSVLKLCARQELLLAVRSRSTQVFAAVFATLALVVASAGYILSGGSGFQDFSRTAASLVQLVLLLVPLTSLVLGVVTLTPEAGEAALLFSQPVARQVILAGKLLGVFIALVAAQAIGFGAAGLVVFWRTGSDGLPGYLGVMAGSIALTAVFLAIAAAIAAGETSRRRARHLAVGLVVWFAAVVLYDVAALGIASVLRSSAASRLLIMATLVNPVDAVRTGSLLQVSGTTAFGAASMAFLRFTGGALGAAIAIVGSVVIWIFGTLVAARIRIARSDL
jgi:Cu-processing system permease protein